MPAPDLQHLRLSRAGEVVIIEVVTKSLQGPALAQEFGAELREVAAQEWAKRLLVDFRKVHYLSSTGFAVLFKVALEIKEAGGEMKLCGMDQQLRLGADIVHLDTVVEIHENEAAALKSFTAA
jgi:anti-anti-sigma factor